MPSSRLDLCAFDPVWSMSFKNRTMAEVSIALWTHADRFPLVYSAANLSRLRFASSVNDTVMMVLSSLMVNGTNKLLINNPKDNAIRGLRAWAGVEGGVV